MKKPSEKLKALKEMRDIQGEDGNWNYDLYTLGLFNAFELAVAICEDRVPNYKAAPEQWLSDNPKLDELPKPSSYN
ncbi:hypothetical protein ACQKM1_22450 [Peribacillus frigoritolerans]|uniref:hypothetical protein n=1 Tax=Peribacillus frigoritolerans TaxID=450367 RepID=UPI003D05EA38